MGQGELCQGFPRVEGAMPELHGAGKAVPGLPQGHRKLCQSLPLRGKTAELGLF